MGTGVTASSSTSKTRSPVGAPPMLGPLPYASAPGIHSRRFSPTTMSWRPSVQPLMTWLSLKLVGSPRATELSNIFPSLVHPV